MNTDTLRSHEPRSSVGGVDAERSFKRKVIFRWVLFVALIIGCILGMLNFWALVDLGVPGDPANKKRWIFLANAYLGLFLVGGLGAIAVFILNIRWHVRRTSIKASGAKLDW
jgi:hypothetical protein